MASQSSGDEPALGYFEGDPIWGTKLRVKGLGDGLSKLAAVDPQELRRGNRVVLLVEAFVNHVAFPEGENEWHQPGVDRLHVLTAGRVTIVDPATVSDVLDAHQRKLDELSQRMALFDGKGEPTPEAAVAESEPDTGGTVTDLPKSRRRKTTAAE